MFSMHQKKTVDLGQGASVVVRGMSAAEFAEFADASRLSDDRSQPLRKAMVGVVSAQGFQYYTDEAQTKAAPVPAAEITADWLVDNLPYAVVNQIGDAIMELSQPSAEEKKG